MGAFKPIHSIYLWNLYFPNWIQNMYEMHCNVEQRSCARWKLSSCQIQFPESRTIFTFPHNQEGSRQQLKSEKSSFDCNRLELSQQAPIRPIGFQPGLKVQLIAEADSGQFSTRTCSTGTSSAHHNSVFHGSRDQLKLRSVPKVWDTMHWVYLNYAWAGSALSLRPQVKWIVCFSVEGLPSIPTCDLCNKKR